MMKFNRFSASRIVIFVLILAALLVFEAHKKVPCGPADGSELLGNAPASRPWAQGLRVATFNIDGGAEGIGNVAHAMADFDLVGMEEVHGADQATAVLDDKHCTYLYAPVETQWWFKSCGNAAVTDLAVNHWERIPISANDSDSNRNVIFLSANYAGLTHPLRILITHIDRQADHSREIQMVANLFTAMEPPAILMGDFNCEEGDPDIANLKKAPDVIDPIGKGYDRIFVRGFTPTASGFIDEHASDHPLAWADLRLISPRPEGAHHQRSHKPAVTSPPSTTTPAN